MASREHTRRARRRLSPRSAAFRQRRHQRQLLRAAVDAAHIDLVLRIASARVEVKAALPANERLVVMVAGPRDAGRPLPPYLDHGRLLVLEFGDQVRRGSRRLQACGGSAVVLD
jgi:hypothetical protein